MTDHDYEPTPWRELAEPTMPSPKLIRQWALSKGLPIGKRGKIPADVVMAYREATR